MELSTPRRVQAPALRSVMQDSLVEFAVLAPQVSVVALAGEHDLSTAERVSASLALASERPNVIFDLSMCEFLDASILALIVKRVRALDAAGSFGVVAPAANTAVSRTLGLAGIRLLCRVHESVAEALAATPTQETNDGVLSMTGV